MEATILRQGMNNPVARASDEYPRMMYRATEDEHREYQTDEHAKCGVTWLVTNKYAGYLCDTVVANDATEAEFLASEGWDITPAAAHGVTDGLAVVVSAKDDRIAELEAQLAAMQDGDGDPVRRGPGRPRKDLQTAE